MAESNEEVIEKLSENLEEELKLSHGLEEDENQSIGEIDDKSIDDEFDESEVLLRLKEEETSLSTEEKEERRRSALQLKVEGNSKFRDNLFEEAVKLYTSALHTCSLQYENDRAILYGNRAAALAKLGEKQKAISDCDKSIELKPDYVKALARRAKLYEETDKLDEALADYKTVLELEPSNSEAREAVRSLPRRIEEKNEKLKAEMMGKLKDLGNLVLRPFGLSTDSFQINKDPSTGSFSISMKQ